MNRTAALSALLIALLVAGCSSPAHHKRAVMHNPETGDVEKCEVDALSTWQWQFEEVLDECVRGYEQAGYERTDYP